MRIFRLVRVKRSGEGLVAAEERTKKDPSAEPGNHGQARIANPLISADPLGSFGFARPKPHPTATGAQNAAQSRPRLLESRNFHQATSRDASVEGPSVTGTAFGL